MIKHLINEKAKRTQRKLFEMTEIFKTYMAKWAVEVGSKTHYKRPIDELDGTDISSRVTLILLNRYTLI